MSELSTFGSIIRSKCSKIRNFVMRMLILLIVVFQFRHVHAQLASDPDAGQKLIDAFITLDQISAEYCCRGTGTYSLVQEDAPKIMNVFVMAAKSQGFEFHTWGTQDVEGPTGASPFVLWHDALRAMKSHKNRFKISMGDGTRIKSSDQEFETESQLAKDPKMVWNWPEIDPLGLVFGTESRLQRRESALDKVRDFILPFQLESSVVQKNGNTYGQWKSPKGGTVMSVEFDREHGDLPKLYKWERLVGNGKRELISQTTTTWTNYQHADSKRFVPLETKILTERSIGEATEVQLTWEWISAVNWKNNKPEFEKLFDPAVENFRKPFMDVFEPEKKK